MNVLHINSNYLTSRLHENLMDRLSKSSFENTVFMPIKSEKKAEYVLESKYEVHAPVTFSNWDKYFYTLKQAKIYKKLHNSIDVTKFDLIHAHTVFSDGYTALKLYEDYGIPYIVTFRGMTDFKFLKLRPNLRSRGRKILKNAEKVIFLSEDNREELFDKYIDEDTVRFDDTFIIPNGIDDYWFENQGVSKELDHGNQIDIIYVGKLTKEKNLPSAIEAFNLLVENGLNINLTVVGEIVNQGIYDYMNRDHKVNISYKGKLKREELIDEYRSHDIFILPSKIETFGLVYPEALSQGLPLVYSKNSGFASNFEDGYIGYSIDPYNYLDIASSTLKVINEYSRLSKNTLKAYRKFNWDNISKDYIETYSSVIDNSKRVGN